MRWVSLAFFAPVALGAVSARAEAGDARLATSGYLQLDLDRHDLSVDQLDDGSGAPLNDDAFVVRRARLRAEGSWRFLGVIAEAHFDTVNGPSLGARQLEAFAAYPGDQDGDPPLLRFGAGSFEVPFGYEVYGQSNRERLFTERALMAAAFFPGEFDLGARLSGTASALSWVIAVQNGEPLGVAPFPLRDPNAAKDFAGRVRLGAPLPFGIRLDGAVSALVGEGLSRGTPPTKDVLVWRDFNEDGLVQNSELSAILGAAARPSEGFRRWALGADLQLRAAVPVLGELSLYGELALAVNLDRAIRPADPIALGRDQRSLGWYVALSQELTEHAMIGVRVDHYAPNIDALELQGGETVLLAETFTTWTFAVAGRIALGAHVRARAILEYALADNALGRDDAGLPARLDADVLRLRVEVGF